MMALAAPPDGMHTAASTERQSSRCVENIRGQYRKIAAMVVGQMVGIFACRPFVPSLDEDVLSYFAANSTIRFDCCVEVCLQSGLGHPQSPLGGSVWTPNCSTAFIFILPRFH